MHLLLNWRLHAARSAKRSAVAQAEIPLTKMDAKDVPKGLFPDA
jgi:hypothetical protein